MSLVLLILGILATVAGVVTIGFGIPINEFSLGNTLIVAGTTAMAAGLILVGLAAAVEQLTRIAAALRPRAGRRPVQQAQPQAVEQGIPAPIRPPTPQFPIQPPVPPAPAVPPPGQIKPPMPPLAPRGPIAKPREEQSEEPTPPEPSFSAIDRLRASMGRTDRKANEAANAADQEAPYIPLASPAVAPPTRPVPPVNPGVGPGPNPAANGVMQPPPAAEAPKKPPLDFLFRSRARATPSDPFEQVWPKRGAPPDAAASPASAPADALPERPAQVESSLGAADDGRPAAILKSGVVDGMAYTLYSDGSIEAQLPQGTVRFGSIAELRSHIENSS